MRGEEEGWGILLSERHRTAVLRHTRLIPTFSVDHIQSASCFKMEFTNIHTITPTWHPRGLSGQGTQSDVTATQLISQGGGISMVPLPPAHCRSSALCTHGPKYPARNGFGDHGDGKTRNAAIQVDVPAASLRAQSAHERGNPPGEQE